MNYGSRTTVFVYILSERLNQKIGERLNDAPAATAKWDYTVCETLAEALSGADFVACSILPGTLDDMECDVHIPEKYGIWQSVGDTAGPGGVLRAMRTVPFFQEFAEAIKKYCPSAWVINLTNPMTLCCKALFDTYPGIRAFGCCHEVFNAEEFLCCVIKDQLGVERPDRHELVIDASGINHFTWITEARWRDVDVFSLLPGFIEKYYDRGCCEDPLAESFDDFRSNPFRSGNKVKMDMHREYGVLAAAGDRHLVEFIDRARYLSDPGTAEKWLYHLTPVSFRKAGQLEKIKETEALASGALPVDPKRSSEELIALMKAILGFGPVISNANTLNHGQMRQLPDGNVVEVNHVFDNGCVRPIIANPLPAPVIAMVGQNSRNMEECFAGIKARDLDRIFASFMAQPLCSGLSEGDGERLFREMALATRGCLDKWYDLGVFE